MAYPALPNYHPAGQPVFYVPIPAGDMPSNGYWADGSMMKVNPAVVMHPPIPSGPVEMTHVSIAPAALHKADAIPAANSNAGASTVIVESDSDDAPLLSSSDHDPELANNEPTVPYNIQDASKHWIRTVKACSIISIIWLLVILSVGFGVNMMHFPRHLSVEKSSFFLVVWGSSVGIIFSILQTYGSFKRQLSLVIGFWVGIGASSSLFFTMLASFLVRDGITAPISVCLLLTYFVWIFAARKVVHIKRCRCD